MFWKSRILCHLDESHLRWRQVLCKFINLYIVHCDGTTHCLSTALLYFQFMFQHLSQHKIADSKSFFSIFWLNILFRSSHLYILLQVGFVSQLGRIQIQVKMKIPTILTHNLQASIKQNVNSLDTSIQNHQQGRQIMMHQHLTVYTIRATFESSQKSKKLKNHKKVWLEAKTLVLSLLARTGASMWWPFSDDACKNIHKNVYLLTCEICNIPLVTVLPNPWFWSPIGHLNKVGKSSVHYLQWFLQFFSPTEQCFFKLDCWLCL